MSKDEAWLDGMKLPTDKDVQTWKENDGSAQVCRVNIDGGHLYFLMNGTNVCFVPDNSIGSNDEEWSRGHKIGYEQGKKVYQNELDILHERIQKLEQHHVRQIDENRKINQRFKELEFRIKEYNEIILGACPIEIEKMNRSEKIYSDPSAKVQMTNPFQYNPQDILNGAIHPRDTLQLCKHGAPVKTCTACY